MSPTDQTSVKKVQPTYFNLYKNKKELLPAAHKLNIPVDPNWTENIMHNTDTAKNELAQVYKAFSFPELEAVINKIKRKAPGQDNFTIDCFKHLGPGGKPKHMYNEAYTRSVRATHLDPTIMVFFDAKKAFESVWDGVYYI